MRDWARALGHDTFSVGGLCWLLLWAGINTGPWNLRFDLIEANWNGFFNGVRAALPLAVLAVWIFHLASRTRAQTRSLSWPEALWLYYGLVMLASSVYADPWFDYAYWGLAYISAFAATEMYLRESSSYRRARDLNRLNWFLGSVVLAALVWIARGRLLAPTSMGLSGYGVLDRLPTVAGMPMARASGISRLAATPAIVAFPTLWYARGRTRVFPIPPEDTSACLVWMMQSRGSLMSFAAALSVVMLILSRTARWFGTGMLALVAALLALGLIPAEAIHHMWLFATRGTRGQELLSMSGRTRIFHNTWRAIEAAPFIGYGPQADRRIPDIGNAQNGVLYSLLCAGFLGGSGYIAGLAASWLALFRIARYRQSFDAGERMTFARIAGIMAFFTIRNFPENCAALFSVDLLVQLPAIVYLGEMDRQIARVAAALRASQSLRPRRALSNGEAARVNGYRRHAGELA